MYLVTKTKFLLGKCVEDANGKWRFIPNVCGRRASRKAWPNAVACIPAWAFDQSDDLLTQKEWNAVKSGQA